MKTYLLELKLKDTEPIDWKKGLTSYLRRSYGSGQWSQFYDEKLVSELNHVRNNANGELAPESLLEQNCLYYAFLEQLHLRLGSNSGQLKLDFTWYDAEYNAPQKSNKCSQHNLVLEKSCTLYNIGVLLRQVAKEKLSGDYNLSVGYLSKAMSCFEFLSENFLNSPSVDLEAENTKFLSDTSHAEAQELFLLKLINKGDAEKHASLVSKLSYAVVCLIEKCSQFYEETEDLPARYGEIRWRSIIKCKSHFYKAVTAYYYALHLEQQSKIGEAIGFLKLANDCLISSFIFKTHLKDYIDFQLFKEMVEEKEKQLTKDNDFIYHESVPQSVEIEAIKSMDAIKAPSWPKQLETYMEQVADKCDTLYKGIVPIEIYEKESIYSEEKANFLRKEMDASETADWEYSSFIEFTNLPKLLGDLERRYKNGSLNESDNPQLDIMREQVASWADSTQKSPYRDVEQQIKLIVTKRQEILEILPQLSGSQKENVVKIKSALVEASQSDERLFSLVKPFIEEMKLLKDSNLLWRNFNSFAVNSTNQPSLLDLDDTKSEKIVDKLRLIRQLSEDLRLLKEERSRNLQELKEELNKDDITKVLLLHRKNSDSELREIFGQEINKFKPFSARIEATIYKQTSTINEIKTQLDEVFKLSGFQNRSKEELESAEKCRQFVDKLGEAFANFGVFCSDISKGLAFYDSLLKMSKNLLISTKDENVTGNNSLAPPKFQIGEGLRDLSLSETHGTPPLVPPRTYSEISPIQQRPYGATKKLPSSTAPPIPPKPEFSTAGGQRLDTQDFEEQELQNNPTSFYNRPSVFDENLYSKFSR